MRLQRRHREIAKVPVWHGLVRRSSIRFTLLFRTTITIGAASKDIVCERRVATRHAISVADVIPPRIYGASSAPEHRGR